MNLGTLEVFSDPKLFRALQESSKFKDHHQKLELSGSIDPKMMDLILARE